MTDKKTKQPVWLIIPVAVMMIVLIIMGGKSLEKHRSEQKETAEIQRQTALYLEQNQDEKREAYIKSRTAENEKSHADLLLSFTDKEKAGIEQALANTDNAKKIKELEKSIAESQDNPESVKTLNQELEHRKYKHQQMREMYLFGLYHKKRQDSLEGATAASVDGDSDLIYTNVLEYQEKVRSLGSKKESLAMDSLIKKAMSDDLLSEAEFKEIKSLYVNVSERVALEKLKANS